MEPVRHWEELCAVLGERVMRALHHENAVLVLLG